MASDQRAEALKTAPPPWTNLRAIAYFLPFWVSRAAAANLPSIAYSPLEAESSFAAPGEGCRPVGGLGSIQILRYTDTPVGPYDELMIAPAEHEYVVEEGKNGETKRRRRNQRITRIYVSKKESCYNGRLNWSIPKHLARFEWEDTLQGTTVKVYPHDLDTTLDPSESKPSEIPFFQATFKTMRFVPSFPLALSLAKIVGFDTRIAHPPLPMGKGSQGELPGSESWCRMGPKMASWRAHLGWMDMQQPDEPERAEGVGEHFWPGFRRWMLAVRLDDCHINMTGQEYWKPLMPPAE